MENTVAAVCWLELQRMPALHCYDQTYGPHGKFIIHVSLFQSVNLWRNAMITCSDDQTDGVVPSQFKHFFSKSKLFSMAKSLFHTDAYILHAIFEHKLAALLSFVVGMKIGKWIVKNTFARQAKWQI